ncbi:MAG: hypothetical protein PHZ00_08135 [Candidatus Peribacteraceae bacterium]|nr:hypothetical protein [Candidatus Peribacteraceae bacterium]
MSFSHSIELEKEEELWLHGVACICPLHQYSQVREEDDIPLEELMPIDERIPIELPAEEGKSSNGVKYAPILFWEESVVATTMIVTADKPATSHANTGWVFLTIELWGRGRRKGFLFVISNT